MSQAKITVKITSSQNSRCERFRIWSFLFFMRAFLKNKLWQKTSESKLRKKDPKKNALIS